MQRSETGLLRLTNIVLLTESDAAMVELAAAAQNVHKRLDLSVYKSSLALARGTQAGQFIQQGSPHHTAVTGLQNRLSSLGYDVQNDGLFGPETQKAVKEFQRDNSLQQDGIVGQQTYGALVKGQTRPGRFTNPADVGIDEIGRVVGTKGVGGGATQTTSGATKTGVAFRPKGTSATGTRAPKVNTQPGQTATMEHPIGQTDPSKAPGAIKDPYAASNSAFEDLHPRAYNGTFASKGSSGEQTKGVQQALNASSGRNRLKVDGEFGQKTDKAVRSFQKSNGLTVDGIVGPQTGNALVHARNTSRVIKRLGITPPRY